MLQRKTSSALADWIFEDILCRWGTLVEIVSNNGPAFVKALNQLAKKYHVWHIRISGYNSRANGIAERPYFNVRQALFKAVDGDQAKWNHAAHFVFWADHITVQHRMGCLPYFAVTRTHPLLPLNIAKATYLLPPLTTTLSTTDFIAQWAIALQNTDQTLPTFAAQLLLKLTNLEALLNISQERLWAMEDSQLSNNDTKNDSADEDTNTSSV
ncbi:hypothetical protein HETIRDRAFT_454503 [Heterobasidion irregulare TC 32-1]|uniref:Integrase catalytic domain-containing protein n=1 Tax=Heterobasidion irregulare (strain TC 32-1) TaxID=747525 RepID=W4JU88_HETIT|nr:uncharacterized protein HETIRDRAFT_454503 [Heterobasidion irregulare TC 32-1]ETW77117.1 hypothetical protein HETIRDRAFT_454503 [Heterobasidion irregulare TC 32-1]